MAKKLSKKVKMEIEKYINDNQPKMDWYGADFDKTTIEEILNKGLNEYIDELWEYNLEYISDLEQYLIDQIKMTWNEYDPDELEEFSREFICVDMNIDNLLTHLPDVVVLAYVYSNYDCCNSFDVFEPDTYLGEVYDRVKDGVKLEDYMYEFHNGAYGGSLFAFAIRTDIRDALELMEKIKTGKTIKIYKGTQFGFFSSFQGAGSVFEKTTFQDMEMPMYGDTEYDHFGIVPDLTQHYSMVDVYGTNSFVDGGNVDIIGEEE
jgi:hypothetical protein